MGRWKTLTILLACWLLPQPVWAGGGQDLLGKDVISLGISSEGSGSASAASLAKIDVIFTKDPLDTGRLYATVMNLKADTPLATRGAREIQIYRNAAASVVMVVTNEGSGGSGSIVNKDGKILTNWHVVEGHKQVFVVFKPTIEGQQLTKADIFRAHVTKVDEVADLALLQVLSSPSNVKPIKLGKMSEVQVGADVHAIGHPTGESWTYTKGIVSQIRKGYSWITESQRQHHADVIQTQTPINPGNSGGPLISDTGHLIGVNSFKAAGEGLNFAVSVDEVRQFLIRRQSRRAPSPSSAQQSTGQEQCQPRQLSSERGKDNQSTLISVDLTCDGKHDAWFVVPDDPNQATMWAFDEDGNGKFDLIYIDDDRDGNIDRSLHDVDGDGKSDLMGYHRNGEVQPYRLEPYG